MDGAAHSADPVPHTRPKKGGYLRQYELVNKVQAYNPACDERALNAAYVFAVSKHGEQKRASGDPYFSHPVSVAGLLADLRLDDTTIIAGLLHDTVEDTDASLSEITELFGADVAELVNGVTKLTQLEYQSEETKQAENFRKFILASVNDLRVLVVKLADRLHNMRTLHFVSKPEKRKRIARETMEIYAPLARRVGLYGFASELEDISFGEINPEARKAIVLRLDELTSERSDDIERISADLEALLADAGVTGRIEGRRKSPYSIWRKLERKSITFNDVADIFAFRLIVGTKAECYQMLGAAHTRWACLPDRFRDFISVPKPNGYRSLHTTVRATSNRKVELQIRTETMHAVAQNGIAAHWGYKDEAYGFDTDAAREAGFDAERSLKAFADLISHGGEAQDFLEHAKLEMYRDQVFVFTPNGRLVVLPHGAMPLDFAYAVHTAIGDTFRGARINGEVRPPRTVLRNGDVVEIIRGDRPAPYAGWEATTITGRARSAVRRLVRAGQSAEFTRLGQNLVHYALQRVGLDPADVEMADTARKAGFETVDELFSAVGRGRLSTTEFLNTAFPGADHDLEALAQRTPVDSEHADLLVAGRDLTPGVTLHFGQCCCPLPPERIIGVHTPEQGVTVHTIYCSQLASYDDQPEAWVDLAWTEFARDESVAVGQIKVNAAHKKGVLASLCSAVTQANGNIVRLATMERDADFIALRFDVEVEDLRHLTEIIAALRSLSVVDSAERLMEADL